MCKYKEEQLRKKIYLANQRRSKYLCRVVTCHVCQTNLFKKLTCKLSLTFQPKPTKPTFIVLCTILFAQLNQILSNESEINFIIIIIIESMPVLQGQSLFNQIDCKRRKRKILSHRFFCGSFRTLILHGNA